MRTIDYTVTESFDGHKVIHFLRGYAGLSSRLLCSLKRVENGLLLNSVHTRTIDIIHTGDILTVNIPDEKGKTSKPIDYELDVVYEDEDMLVVNKPAMLPMHESHNHQGDTLANAVSGYLMKKGIHSRFRAIGRLDKGTSGIVVCALNSHCAARLSGNIKKTYFAIPTGKYENDSTIDLPIYRPDPMKTLRAVGETGDRAVTHFQVMEYGENYSLLKVNLETGRTHQIRVHFSAMGTPLYGDKMYGKDSPYIERQALHCGEAIIIHPITGEKIICKVPLPDDMKNLLLKLRSQQENQ